MPLATIERKAGHRRFIVLFLLFYCGFSRRAGGFRGAGTFVGAACRHCPEQKTVSLMYLWDDGKSQYGGDDDAYDD